MHVLHVIPSLSASQGGPSRAIVDMEQALAEQGVQVDTASTDDDGRGRHMQRPCGQRLPEGTAHRWYFRKWLEPYKVAPGLLAWLFGEVSRFDVVHIHTLFSFSSTMAAWVARWRGVPYVVRPLGVLARYGMTQRRPWLKKLSFALVEAPILRAAAAVHFTSQAEQDEAVVLGVPLRGVVIPLAVAPHPPGDAQRALQRLQPPAQGLRVLFLSRIDPKKNLDGLIRAMALASQQGLVLTLLVAGSGPDALVAKLQRLADELGVAAQIRWLGHVEGQEKADLLAAADVFALPSHSENFGIAVAEALAAGLPCIVGKGVALASAVDQAQAGLAVEPGEASVCSAIMALAGDAERRRAMGMAARELARSEFSTSAMGQRLVALYRSVARAVPASVSA